MSKVSTRKPPYETDTTIMKKIFQLRLEGKSHLLSDVVLFSVIGLEEYCETLSHRRFVTALKRLPVSTLSTPFHEVTAKANLFALSQKYETDLDRQLQQVIASSILKN